ncbi:hypothetical protein AB1N83_003099 [Pleurotus pulmonarius]
MNGRVTAVGTCASNRRQSTSTPGLGTLTAPVDINLEARKAAISSCTFVGNIISTDCGDQPKLMKTTVRKESSFVDYAFANMDTLDTGAGFLPGSS